MRQKFYRALTEQPKIRRGYSTQELEYMQRDAQRFFEWCQEMLQNVNERIIQDGGVHTDRLLKNRAGMLRLLFVAMERLDKQPFFAKGAES
jgi:hypothetical protein